MAPHREITDRQKRKERDRLRSGERRLGLRRRERRERDEADRNVQKREAFQTQSKHDIPQHRLKPNGASLSRQMQ